MKYFVSESSEPLVMTHRKGPSAEYKLIFGGMKEEIMRRYLSLLLPAIFILFLLAGCNGSGGSSNKGTVTLTPDTETKFSFGNATVDIPKGTVTRTVECSYEVIPEYPEISAPEQAVTYIHQLSFSDPDAVDAEEHSASISFSLKNVTDQYSIYQYSDYFNDWTDLGRFWPTPIPGADTVKVLMSGLPTSYVVVKNSELGASPNSASNIIRAGPYITKNSGEDNTYIISFHSNSLYLWQYYKHTFDIEYGFGTDKDTPVYGNQATLDVVDYNYGNLDSGFGNWGNVYHFQFQADSPTNNWGFYKLVFYHTNGDVANVVDGRFHLAPPKDRQYPISFYAYGDTKSNPAVHNAVVHLINHDWYVDPDKYQTFIVHDGDFAHYGKEVGSWLNDYFHNNKYASTGTFLSSLILVPNVGNHEFKPQSDSDYHPPADVYEVYFDDPGRPDYPMHGDYFYTFTYGFIKVIGCSSFAFS